MSAFTLPLSYDLNSQLGGFKTLILQFWLTPLVYLLKDWHLNWGLFFFFFFSTLLP